MLLFCLKKAWFLHYFELFCNNLASFFAWSVPTSKKISFFEPIQQNFFSKALVDSQNNNIEHGLEDIFKTQRCLWIGEITILKFLPNIKIFYSKREYSQFCNIFQHFLLCFSLISPLFSLISSMFLFLAFISILSDVVAKKSWTSR